MSHIQRAQQVSAFWAGGPFQKRPNPLLHMDDCPHCEGTGMGPGFDAQTECGFCEYRPVVIISKWGDPLLTN
jgi:hypothetical protein